MQIGFIVYQLIPPERKVTLNKSIAVYQKEAREFLGEELKHPRLGAVLGLGEEIGELIKEIMDLEIYNTPSFPMPEGRREKLGHEAADILFSLFEVCSHYDLNLEEAYKAKFEKIKSQRSEWILKYSRNLQARREKLDS